MEVDFPPAACDGWATFALCVPGGTPITLNPREHTDYRWLPWREAADWCYSPSNADACLLLPRLATAGAGTTA